MKPTASGIALAVSRNKLKRPVPIQARVAVIYWIHVLAESGLVNKTLYPHPDNGTIGTAISSSAAVTRLLATTGITDAKLSLLDDKSIVF
jgi:hypothetical protein